MHLVKSSYPRIWLDLQRVIMANMDFYCIRMTSMIPNLVLTCYSGVYFLSPDVILNMVNNIAVNVLGGAPGMQGMTNTSSWTFLLFVFHYLLMLFFLFTFCRQPFIAGSKHDWTITPAWNHHSNYHYRSYSTVSTCHESCNIFQSYKFTFNKP